MSGRKILTIVIIFHFIIFNAFAPPNLSIKITGKWNLKIDENDLVGGAGTTFPDAFESKTDEISITISKTTTPTTPWRVDIRRIDINWHPNLTLFVKRTSDGTGDGTIDNGTTYQQVTLIDQFFFSGTGERSKIDIQLKIEGVSLPVPVDTYSTEIYYTVTEL
jgi:hypothetical protein